MGHLNIDPNVFQRKVSDRRHQRTRLVQLTAKVPNSPSLWVQTDRFPNRNNFWLGKQKKEHIFNLDTELIYTTKYSKNKKNIKQV
jgi:hypothetical protein